MRRDQLEHAIRTASQIIGLDGAVGRLSGDGVAARVREA